MAVEINRTGFPGIAAPSQSINEGDAVCLGSGADRAVARIGTSGARPFGVARASAPIQGQALSVADADNVVAVTAAASLGQGALIGVATWGRFGPVAAASGSVVWAIGESQSAAAAGEKFSLYINPRQLSGLA